MREGLPQALLPLSLLSTLKTGLTNSAQFVKDNIPQVPNPLWYITGRHATETDVAEERLQVLETNLRKTLTATEYENLMDHVNKYMEQLVELKIQNQRHQENKESVKLIKEQIQLILLENNEQIMNKLSLKDISEQEINKLVVLVLEHLKNHGWQPSEPKIFTTEKVEIIRELISEQLVKNQQKLDKDILGKIDLKEFLERLLSIPLLSEFIDGRIGIVQQRQHNFEDLKDNLDFMKLQISEKLSENADLQRSISKLQVAQDEMLQKLREHELFMDERYGTLLLDIEKKFAELESNNLVLLNKQIKLVLVDIFGFKKAADAQATGAVLDDADLEAWVRNTFVAKDYLEERLLSLQNLTLGAFRSELDHTAAILMRTISERLKQDTLTLVHTKHEEFSKSGNIKKSDELLSEKRVREIVRSVLAVYDADKTGLADYALESAGGQVLSTRCTENYQIKSAQISIFGIPLWYPSNTPRVVISPNVQPGNCWAFQGFPGHLVLKLNSMVYVTAFTLEHIPRNLSPSGNINSAPRNFTVWGLEFEKDPEPVLFGEYEYVDDTNEALQYFVVQNKSILRPYNIVELRIETNHGHALYTCLYRFRVHGNPAEL